jgi:hypothetical protein
MADNNSFQIDRFKSNFKTGGARPNLFRVMVDLSAGQGGGDKLTFTCRAASLPAATLGTIEVPYFGRKVKVAGDRTFAEWTITVLNDEDFVVRRSFELWNNRINSHNANVRASGVYNIEGGSGAYKKNADIFHYDKKGNTIAQYRLLGSYPSEIGAIELAWDTNDTIEEYTVTLQYDYWESVQPGPGIY